MQFPARGSGVPWHPPDGCSSERGSRTTVLARSQIIPLFAIAYRLWYPFLRVCTAVHRGNRNWPAIDWPDAAPRRDFRNLWLAAARSDTGIAGASDFSGGPKSPARRGIRRRYTEVALKGHRSLRGLVASLA